MIDVIRQQFNDGMSPGQRLNLTREFLQLLTLKILYDKDLFAQLAFVGGTSLRILYDLKRFSEDLDFSLVNRESYDFEAMHRQLAREFQLYNLPFEARLKTDGNIHGMMMRFTGLLKELGLSELPGQKLSIKFEVDTNPPSGWVLGSTIVNKRFLFNTVHYDLPSLFAGKLHACFYRSFTKGRDFYDLVWYLGKRVRPNLLLLNNAIQQTRDHPVPITEDNLPSFLLDHIQAVDFVKVKKDVERFLEDKNELKLLDPQLIQDTVKNIF